MQPDQTCSAQSIAHNEDLLGTGVGGAVHWVGLQVCAAWRPKALKDNDLPAPVQDWLRALMARGDCRPVFIKRRGRRAGVTVFYANVIEGRVHRFDLETYEQVPELPWQALIDGSTELGRTDEQPIFVCTHSARDHCCGLHGAGVSRALGKVAPDRVWQCSHLGGHRFAATLVALPQGVHYGRVRAAEAESLVRALDEDRIYDLHRLRGQTRYPMAVQAAVDHTRRSRGLSGLDQVVATDWESAGERTRVRIQAADELLELQVHREKLPGQLRKSCTAEPSQASRWVVQPAEG